MELAGCTGFAWEMGLGTRIGFGTELVGCIRFGTELAACLGFALELVECMELWVVAVAVEGTGFVAVAFAVMGCFDFAG